MCAHYRSRRDAAAFPSLTNPARVLALPVPTPALAASCQAAGELISEGERTPAHVVALLMLEYIVSGIDLPRESAKLAGLPLLPLRDGSLGVLRTKVNNLSSN